MSKKIELKDIVQKAEDQKKTISEIVIEEQASELGLARQDIFERMAKNLFVMKESEKKLYDTTIRSTSGLTGLDAQKIRSYAKTEGIMGGFMNRVMARACSVSECNAAMGKIVAAPTAGSCGILPAVLISLIEEKNCTDEKATMALFTAGEVGIVIAQVASIAGAAGGCQVECGSAAAMTAASIVEIAGGTPTMCAHAVAIALKNQLGLVCDPVAGLVEIPCIKRNIAGAMIAFSSAEMALAGVQSYIPVDEVIQAMAEIGNDMQKKYKETALGGLATTPTGLQYRKQIFGR
ncbi:MAG: L-serine ammonia-lyase, iron-sulfur-dependent, subunit alpha [Treponemataceae bacterium]